MQVLITGSAGFIGYHLAKALARQGIATYGIDSINSYYDVSLKKARLKACGIDLSRQEQEYRSTLYPNYTFRQMDLCDKPALDALFASRAFDTVINLAAQAGVRIASHIRRPTSTAMCRVFCIYWKAAATIIFPV